MIQLIQPFPTPLNRLHEWREGDTVTAVDGRPVEDMLDLYYYMPRGTTMDLTIRRADDQECSLKLEPYALDQVMSCFAAMEFKTCACDCVLSVRLASASLMYKRAVLVEDHLPLTCVRVSTPWLRKSKVAPPLLKLYGL